jgi:hypothetical protein
MTLSLSRRPASASPLNDEPRAGAGDGGDLPFLHTGSRILIPMSASPFHRPSLRQQSQRSKGAEHARCPVLRRGEGRRRILTGSSAAPSIPTRPPPAPSIPAPFATAFSSPARGDSEWRPWQLELGRMELGGQRKASPVVERHSPRRRGPVNRRRRELPAARAGGRISHASEPSPAPLVPAAVDGGVGCSVGMRARHRRWKRRSCATAATRCRGSAADGSRPRGWQGWRSSSLAVGLSRPPPSAARPLVSPLRGGVGLGGRRARPPSSSLSPSWREGADAQTLRGPHATSLMEELQDSSGSKGIWRLRHFPVLLEGCCCRQQNGKSLLEEPLAGFCRPQCGWSKSEMTFFYSSPRVRNPWF